MIVADFRNMKKTIWDTILKVVIAVASALAGVFGGQALMA